MSYQVLARKWRPKSFATLVGQEHVVKALSNALANGRLHHAYLLTGTRGVGKTTIARIMAKSLNCETGVTAQPCGICATCLQIDAGRFVDLLEIDAASNTGIDNIREVLDNAQYSPTQGRFKVYIIDEVHMLSKSAFNAMLKTLEEPPGHVKFILATTDPQKVPVTILSRCLQFSLRQMLPQQVADHLKHVLEAEGLPFEAGALTWLSHAAAGSMRDALSLLDQAIAYGSGRVEEAGVKAMLGAVDRSFLFDLLNCIVAQDGAALMQAAEQTLLRGIAPDAALQELAAVLHQVALCQAVPGSLSDDTPNAEDIGRIAGAISAEDTQLYYQIALHGRRDLALAPDEFAGFSMTLLRMLAFAPADPPAMPAGERRSVPNSVIPATAPIAQPASAQPAPALPVSATPQPAQPDIPPPSPQTAEPLPAAAAHTEPSPVAVAPQVETAPPWEPAPTPMAAAPAPEPAPAAEASPPPEPDAPASLDNFDGDWAKLVAALPRGGQAYMLASHAELLRVDGATLELTVPEAHKAMIGRDYQEKLRMVLKQYFAAEVQLRVSIGGGGDATPAAQQRRERQALLAAAEIAINDDPLVRSLIADFGATILPDSIRPRAEAE